MECEKRERIKQNSNTPTSIQKRKRKQRKKRETKFPFFKSIGSRALFPPRFVSIPGPKFRITKQTNRQTEKASALLLATGGNITDRKMNGSPLCSDSDKCLSVFHRRCRNGQCEQDSWEGGRGRESEWLNGCREAKMRGRLQTFSLSLSLCALQRLPVL